MELTRERAVAPRKERTARLTVLIDPRKKAAFERLCAAEDVTPSQVVRRLIREYVEARIGTAWRRTPKARTARTSARR
jgi:Ribbon-helix-helix protein